MAIYKNKRRRGFVYRVRLQLDGQRVSRSFDRKIDAFEYERKAKIDPVFVEESEINFTDAAQEWLENHAMIKKAPRSVATDRQMLRDNLLPVFGSLKLRCITPERIEQFIRAIRKNGIKDVTINRNLELLRSIFNYCIKRRRLMYNPMTVVGLLKTQQPPFDFWNLSEANQFLAYVEAKYRNGSQDLAIFYKFALNTGMRLGEILGLGWHEVDLENRLITVRRSYDSFQHKIKDTTKGYKIRHVPINSAIYDDMIRMKSFGGELVFSTISGKPKDRSNITHYFQRDSIEAGVRKIRFHDLRHTYASHFMMNGGDIYHLKEILGHSDISTTMRYAHLSKSFLVDKADTVCFRTENVIRVNFEKRAVNK